MAEGWGTAAAVGPLTAALLVAATTWARDNPPVPASQPEPAPSAAAPADRPTAASTSVAGGLDERIAAAQRRVARLQRRLRAVQDRPLRDLRPAASAARSVTRPAQQEPAPPADTTSGAS
jgi:hypothetical protein